MPLNALLGATVGAAVGAAAVYGYMHTRPRHPPSTPVTVSPAVVPVAHPALRYGVPIKERIRVFQDHVVGYDSATRNPIWVLEHLNRANAHGEAGRSKEFHEDKAIPARFRVKLADYAGSGLDRGHMAPAMNHKATQKGMDDTFYLTNISPQVGPGFNRDYWARFEKFVKDVVKRADDVYIATGPVFAPSVGADGRLYSGHAFIGQAPQAVGVPTHFFKVVLSERTDPKTSERSTALAAFALPNRPIDPATPLTSFVVPLEFLESVTGVEFFPGAVAEGARRAVDAAAADWRRLGMAQRQALATQGVRQLPDNLPGSSPTLVPANQLPHPRELEGTGVDAGPRQFRPRRAGGRGPAHLCETVACRLPAERFWEKGPGVVGGVRGGNTGGVSGGVEGKGGSVGRPTDRAGGDAPAL